MDRPRWAGKPRGRRHDHATRHFPMVPDRARFSDAASGAPPLLEAAGMSCWETIADYGLRSIGIGERLLPRDGFTLCQQFTLIGSGLIWNIYFGVLALGAGFFLATAVALGKASNIWAVRKASAWFIFVFRGSPLFIQFFFAYFAFQSLKSVYPFFDPFTAAWLGALIVLFLNTAAYSGEIFYGALRSIPKGDVEAADAYGFS